MSVPQMLMLNHASWVNGKKLDSKATAKASAGIEDDPYIERFNKRFSQLSDKEKDNYYSDWG